MRTFCVLVLACFGGCSAQARPGPGEAQLELAGPTVVPLAEGDLPLVTLRLDGRQLAFLIDSGSSISAVDPVRATELGLQVRPYRSTKSTRGTSGRSVAIDRYVSIERLELGALALVRTGLAVLDDEVLRMGSYSGILGQDLLARLVLVLDMERRALHLLPATDRQGIQAYLKEADLGIGAWAMASADFRPSPFLALDLPVDLESPVEIEIDTGSTSTSFPEAWAIALELPRAETDSVEMRGVGGTRQAQAYKLENFGLYGFLVTSQVYSNPLEYGLLGMNVLGEFVLVLDGPGRTLWLHHRTVEIDSRAMPRENAAR